MIHLENSEILNKRLEPDSGVLYVIGTPIGNLGDLSPRAKNLLEKVSLIACEDTRHTGKLLKTLGVQTPLISFHQHNSKSRLSKLLKILRDNESLALVTDAGLPGISDPGEQLVKAVKNLGHEVICIPGPCAATTALVSSGLPSNRFCFEGFLPNKSKERKLILNEIALETRTSILYESPHKLIRLLEELAEVCGNERPLQVGRELTKQYEEHIGSTIGEVISHFKNKIPRGEFTLILGGFDQKALDKKSSCELMLMMNKLIQKGLSPSYAAKEIAEQTGYSRRYLYSILHEEKNN